MMSFHPFCILRSFSIPLYVFTLFLNSVNAQEVPPHLNKSRVTQDSLAVNKLVQPHLQSTFQTGSGAGYSSFGSVYGFIPFTQTPQQSLFYGEGRFSAFTDAGGQAGNLRAGYRHFLPSSDAILGGYAGWDIRHSNTEHTFHQLGLGAEALGDKWEARVNAYIPLGDSTRILATSALDTGLVASELSFVGNQLLISSHQQQSQTTVSEVAFGGVDLEGGYQLGKWDAGNLYGYLGLYLIGAEERDTVLGVRGRLRADTETLLAGLSLQSDAEFGTNFQFSVGVKLGGHRTRQREETTTDSVLARFGQGVERQDILALDRFTKTEITSSEIASVIAVNPDTGQPWNFVHVQDGSSSSGGTFEDPYGEVTEAASEIGTIGTTNDIIYVDAGDRSGMTGFIIPDNVRVLSTGVTQELEIADIGTVQLPGAGTGTLPLIQSRPTTMGNIIGANMGNNTTLSGFEITNIGVRAHNVSNFSIDRNTISTTLNGASGVQIFGHNITMNNVSVSGNTISMAGNIAAGVQISGANLTMDNVSVSGNTISTTGDLTDGVLVLGFNLNINNVSVSGNTISATGNSGDGLAVFVEESIISNTSISGNEVSQAGASSFAIGLLNNSDICIAQFSDNVSTNPNFAGSGGNDLVMESSSRVSVGTGTVSRVGTIAFVDFDNVSANNTGFDDVVGSPSSQPTSCP